MRKWILILIACLSFSCQREVVSSYTDSQIYEMILTEIIQTDSSIIESFNRIEFNDITAKNNDTNSAWTEKANKSRKSYREKHGNLLAIRIGSTQEIDGRILGANFLTLAESTVANLEKEEKESYLELIETVDPKTKLDIPSEIIREDLVYNGRKLKFYRTQEENSVSVHEFSISQIGFSLNKQHGCFYVGTHYGPMAANGRLIFIVKVKNEWRIKKSLGLWIA